jgi:sugar lactone lactonase YvrE
MDRTRRLIGLLCVLALAAIAIGVSGFELAVPRLGAGGNPDGAVLGVRATATTALIRVGAEAPEGSELAFLAIERSGNLLVSDRQRQSILRFDATGHLLSEWGPRLTATDAIAEPAGIATAGDIVYVLDRAIPRLFKLDTTGSHLDTFNLETLGTYGLNGLAVDPMGNIYAADTGRNRILVFSPSGSLVRQFGRGGSGLGEFTQPMALSFAPDGSFFVADWENGRVARFDASFTATDAWSAGFRPFGIAVDSIGRVYAPDAERRRVVAYSSRGALLAELGGGELDLAPRQVATSDADPLTLYVLGYQGVVRLDLQNGAPVPQSADDIDLLSPLLMLLLVAVPIAAVVLRRGRGRPASVGATLHGEVGLQAVNGAQGEHQQPRRDQDLALAVTHESEHQQHAANQHHEPVGDRHSDHSS